MIMRLQRLCMTLAALALLSSTRAQRSEIPELTTPAEKQALLDKGYNPNGEGTIEATASGMDQSSKDFLPMYQEKVAMFTGALITMREERLAQMPAGTAN